MERQTGLIVNLRTVLIPLKIFCGKYPPRSSDRCGCQWCCVFWLARYFTCDLILLSHCNKRQEGLGHCTNEHERWRSTSKKRVVYKCLNGLKWILKSWFTKSEKYDVSGPTTNHWYLFIFNVSPSDNDDNGDY